MKSFRARMRRTTFYTGPERSCRAPWVSVFDRADRLVLTEMFASTGIVLEALQRNIPMRYVPLDVGTGVTGLSQ